STINSGYVRDLGQARPVERREETPAALDPLEQVGTAVLELETGAGNEVLDGRGDEHLSGLCLRHDPGSDVNGDAANAVVHQLHLAGVDPGADLDPLGTKLSRDRACAANCPCRAVE